MPKSFIFHNTSKICIQDSLLKKFSKSFNQKFSEIKLENPVSKDLWIEDSEIEDSEIEDSEIEDSKIEDSEIEDSEIEDSKSKTLNRRL